MSDEYLYLSDLREIIDHDYVWWEEEEAPEAYAVPPININDGSVGYPGHDPKYDTIWSGWSIGSHWYKSEGKINNIPENIVLSSILDYEFIYDPMEFIDLSGSKWSVFRKNIRKWPKHHPDSEYLPLSDDEIGLPLLVSQWILTHYHPRYDYEIHDYYTLTNFCFNGSHRKGIFYQDQLLGMNVWDENHQFINYRCCVVMPGQPFLDEYLRYLFYTDPEILSKEKRVNDGGCLDNIGLQNFKLRLNPIEVNSIYSWKWIK